MLPPRWHRWAWLAPLFLLIPLAALARIGGGDNYVADSRSSSSSGSGDGIPIELIWLVLRLTIEYPHVMLPLLTIGGVWYYWAKVRNGPDRKTQQAFQLAEGLSRTQVTESQRQAMAAHLQRKDPQFTLPALYEHATKTFLQSQQAWARRDLTPIRPLLSDATYQRLVSQLDLMTRQGERPASADMQILGISIIGVEESDGFDTVHLRFHAQARDTEAPANATDEQARERASKVPPQPFIEVWSFVRRMGAQTKIGQDVFQGKCPNCGAPFNGGHTNNCEYCGAVVNSGNYDWTLSQITQGVEHVGAHHRPSGIAAVRERDPTFSVEVLEDRASLIFWKWITAQSHAEPRELAKLASPQFVQQIGAEIESLRSARRERHYLRAAVGGVRVLGLRQAEDGSDEAQVEIRWSAQVEMVNQGETPPRRPPVHQRWVFVLSRAAGATSHPKNGMATSRCPNCNAPLTDTLTSTCDFCSADLSQGGGDWVLKDARTWESWRAPTSNRAQVAPPLDEGTDRLLDLAERKRLLSVMAAMAAADGRVDDRERKLLRMCAQRWHVPWPEVEEWLRRGPSGFGELVQPGSPEAEAFLQALIDMAMVDGLVDKKERQLLQAAAQHLGLTDRLTEMLVRSKPRAK